MKSLFEENGGTYRKAGDYYLPNLALPDEPEQPIGIWGSSGWTTCARLMQVPVGGGNASLSR